MVGMEGWDGEDGGIGWWGWRDGMERCDGGM